MASVLLQLRSVNSNLGKITDHTTATVVHLSWAVLHTDLDDDLEINPNHFAQQHTEPSPNPQRSHPRLLDLPSRWSHRYDLQWMMTHRMWSPWKSPLIAQCRCDWKPPRAPCWPLHGRAWLSSSAHSNRTRDSRARSRWLWGRIWSNIKNGH